jgi:hypothetical protein
MSDLARLIVLLVLVGAVLTGFGAAMIWYMEEGRRLRRALRNVLGGTAEGVLLAPGTGRATAFSFADHQMAVAWDSGAWCLVYSLDELVGAELVADGEVLGRVHRGEQRRALDRAPRDAKDITFRILFDDPAHPDFQLDLWDGHAPKRNGAPATPAGAIQEANRWLARAEAILRRQTVAGVPAAAAPAAVKARPAPEPQQDKPQPERPRSDRDVSEDEDDIYDEEPPF